MTVRSKASSIDLGLRAAVRLAATVLCAVRDGIDEHELADTEDDAPDAENPERPRRCPPVQGTQHGHRGKPPPDGCSQASEVQIVTTPIATASTSSRTDPASNTSTLLFCSVRTCS